MRRRLALALGLVLVLVLAAALVTSLRPPPERADRADRDEPVGPVDPPDERAALCSAFASPDGSDGWPGTAQEPYRTVDRLLRTLSTGETGCLRGGDYDDDEVVLLLRDDTTLRSAPGERATLHLDTLVVPDDTSGVTISHLDIVGGDGELTVTVIGDDFVLEHNDIRNDESGTSCVLVGSSDHTTSGGTIRGNVIHDCGETGNQLHHGIYAQNVGPDGSGSPGLVIEGNVIYDVASYAVQLYPRSEEVVVRRNVIDGGGRSVHGGIVLDGPDSYGHLIEENVIVRTRTGAVVQRTGEGHVSRGNCLWDNSRDIEGDDIRSRGDRVDERCWQSAEDWIASSGAVSDEEGECEDHGPQDLCRLLEENLAGGAA